MHKPSPEPAVTPSHPTHQSIVRHAAFVTPLLLAVAGWAAVLAPAPALAATETRSVAEFQALSLHAGLDVTVRQGAQQSLTLSTEDTVLALLESVVVPRLSVVNVVGRGDVLLQAQATLDVSIVGSGDVQYSGAAKLKKSVMGSGSIQQR